MAFATMGELIDALGQQKKIYGVDFWIQDIQRETPKDEWEEFQAAPVEAENVKILASALRSVIAYEASQWSQEEPYADTKRRGHAILKLLFLIAVDHGLQVGVNEIDGALTPSEMMEAAGIVRIENGKVIFTEEGLLMMDEFKRELEQDKHS